MIQDISPHQFHNEYLPREPRPDDQILIYRDRSVLAEYEEGFVRFPCHADLPGRLADTLRFTYLFSIDETGFYLPDGKTGDTIAAVLEEKEIFSFQTVQIFRTAAPGYLAFAGVTGLQLKNWYDSRVYCGRCGHRLNKDEKERMMRCSHCGQMEYPKICPAVIVAVMDHDRVLLTKYAGREYKKYALIAGFAEIGESIEQTVKREVLEEVGLKVKNIRYYKSQPWSFSDTLLMGFVCDLDGEDTILLDEEELSVGEWCRREEIPADGTDISLTREMMWKIKNHEL